MVSGGRWLLSLRLASVVLLQQFSWPWWQRRYYIIIDKRLLRTYTYFLLTSVVGFEWFLLVRLIACLEHRLILFFCSFSVCLSVCLPVCVCVCVLSLIHI